MIAKILSNNGDVSVRKCTTVFISEKQNLFRINVRQDLNLEEVKTIKLYSNTGVPIGTDGLLYHCKAEEL